MLKVAKKMGLLIVQFVPVRIDLIKELDSCVQVLNV